MPTIFCYTEPGEKVNPEHPWLQGRQKVLRVAVGSGAGRQAGGGGRLGRVKGIEVLSLCTWGPREDCAD